MIFFCILQWFDPFTIVVRWQFVCSDGTSFNKDWVTQLEHWIDEYQEKLPTLKNFILPVCFQCVSVKNLEAASSHISVNVLISTNIPVLDGKLFTKLVFGSAGYSITELIIHKLFDWHIYVFLCAVNQDGTNCNVTDTPRDM